MNRASFGPSWRDSIKADAAGPSRDIPIPMPTRKGKEKAIEPELEPELGGSSSGI
jgi:hypothetical protein